MVRAPFPICLRSSLNYKGSIVEDTRDLLLAILGVNDISLYNRVKHLQEPLQWTLRVT